MRSPSISTMAFVFGLGSAVAAGNLWFCLQRSTIPLALNSHVSHKEVRHEKHVGDDDVCLIRLASGQMLHLDKAVFNQIPSGATIRKEAWQRRLQVNGRPVALTFSPDLRGMLWAMPAIMMIFLVTAVMVAMTKKTIT